MSSVSSAHARLAAMKRHYPEGDKAVRQARDALALAVAVEALEGSVSQVVAFAVHLTPEQRKRLQESLQAAE